MRKLIKTITIAGSLLFLIFFQVDLAIADGPYRGKVIDAETKEPIEGAVVLGVWRKQPLLAFHPKYIFKETKEVLTDKDGEFVLPGYTNIPSIIDPMSSNRIRIYIYKPGYGSFPRHQISPDPKQSHPDKLRPFETHALVELPRLKTREERLRVQECPAGDIPDEKLTNWIRLMNIESQNLGLKVKIRCFIEEFK